MNETRLWELHKTVSESVRFADLKASTVLAILGVMGSFIIPQAMPHAVALFHSPVLAALIVASATSAIVSAALAASALAPRLNVGAPQSTIFFAHIAARHATSDQFLEQAMPRIEDDTIFRTDIASQIWANSRVAYRKFRCATLSIWSLSAFFGFSALAVCLNFSMLLRSP